MRRDRTPAPPPPRELPTWQASFVLSVIQLMAITKRPLDLFQVALAAKLWTAQAAAVGDDIHDDIGFTEDSADQLTADYVYDYLLETGLATTHTVEICPQSETEASLHISIQLTGFGKRVVRGHTWHARSLRLDQWSMRHSLLRTLLLTAGGWLGGWLVGHAASTHTWWLLPIGVVVLGGTVAFLLGDICLDRWARRWEHRYAWIFPPGRPYIRAQEDTDIEDPEQ